MERPYEYETRPIQGYETRNSGTAEWHNWSPEIQSIYSGDFEIILPSEHYDEFSKKLFETLKNLVEDFGGNLNNANIGITYAKNDWPSQ